MTNVLEFPGHGPRARGRFTLVDVTAIRRHFCREIATRGFAVEWNAGVDGDADHVTVVDSHTEEPVVSFGIDDGIFHAIDPIGGRQVWAVGRAMGEVLAGLASRSARDAGA